MESPVRVKTPFTLPRFDPLSSASTGSRDEARLKVRLARLQFEAQEKAQDRQAQLDFRLQVKKMEIEADKAVRLRQLELSQREAHSVENPPSSTFPVSVSGSRDPFDISKFIALVPRVRLNLLFIAPHGGHKARTHCVCLNQTKALNP